MTGPAEYARRVLVVAGADGSRPHDIPDSDGAASPQWLDDESMLYVHDGGLWIVDRTTSRNTEVIHTIGRAGDGPPPQAYEATDLVGYAWTNSFDVETGSTATAPTTSPSPKSTSSTVTVPRTGPRTASATVPYVERLVAQHRLPHAAAVRRVWADGAVVVLTTDLTDRTAAEDLYEQLSTAAGCDDSYLLVRGYRVELKDGSQVTSPRVGYQTCAGT